MDPFGQAGVPESLEDSAWDGTPGQIEHEPFEFCSMRRCTGHLIFIKLECFKEAKD